MPIPERPGVTVPTGQIGHLHISRLICGGNLIIGSAHDRDLLYLAALMRAYFTDRKIMETWRLCEECGVNTMVGPVNSPFGYGEDPTLRVLKRYREELGGKIQWIAQTYPKSDDLTGSIQKAVDNGAVGAFLHGGIADNWVNLNRLDLLARAIEFAKKNGLIAGTACHNLEVPVALEKAGVDLDFYLKTFHSDHYWSAAPKAERPATGLPRGDNMWCLDAGKTAEFMATVKKPWIAFKVLAAGALHPRDGFRFAFQNGADFLNVGMFDFQVREDALLARQILRDVAEKGRRRPWMG